MNYKKLFQLLACFILGGILLAACGKPTPKAGELKGALVTSTGDPQTGQFTIILCRLNAASNKCTLDKKYQATTNDGTFSIRFAPVGDYGVYVAQGTSEGDFLKQQNGKMLIIGLRENTDLDLGKIIITIDNTAP